MISKLGFPDKSMTIRENVTLFCHGSWHFLCSLGPALILPCSIPWQRMQDLDNLDRDLSVRGMRDCWTLYAI